MSHRATPLPLVLVVGCTQYTGDPRFEPISERIAIDSTIPAAMAEIPADAQLDFCFDGYVDPRSVDEYDAVLSSGTLIFDTDLSVQLFAFRPPAEPVGVADEQWCEGSVLSVVPESKMEEGIAYRVIVQPTMRGWAGESLDTSTPGWTITSEGELEYFLEFSVAETDTDGETDSDGAPTDDPPTLTDLFEDDRVFDPDRESCNCHRDTEHLGFRRLDLRTPEDAYEGLVLRVAPEATGFAMVTPGFPSESYLIQKLLRDDDGDPLHEVMGDAMPPDEALGHADMADIAHWVAGEPNREPTLEPNTGSRNAPLASMSKGYAMNRRNLALHCRPTGLFPFVATLLALLAGGCTQNSYDVYLEGLRVAGAAEDGPCALVYDKEEQAHVLDSAKVQQCIDEVEHALELYEKAVAMGHEGNDVLTNIADTKHKLERLRAMVRTIKRIEVDYEVEARSK